MEPNEPLVLTLTRPISLGDQTWDTLTVPEPTVDQLIQARRAGGDEIEITLRLISLAASVPVAALKNLGMSEYYAIDRFIMGFIRPGPQMAQDSARN